eukprot:CAMPEP_0114295346 /NCGR_PEP_ID=MMETSP0059-20121206/10639_1 /TAXON_ID=36894 /ORGANISM="Pyramimonas parkeae, Strain CCMP726" /LENGTH=187 /DNA_ID=CAMNT_0001417241 /DNA_START=750 /DNA_END=1313 /DNA_ORIENTATION=-
MKFYMLWKQTCVHKQGSAASLSGDHGCVAMLTQPPSSLGAGGVEGLPNPPALAQAPCLARSLRKGQQLSARHVAEVALQDHQLVVAQQARHLASRTDCLLLQFGEEIKQGSAVVPAIHNVTGLHEVRSSPNPVALGVNHLAELQHLHGVLKVSMQVANSHETRYLHMIGYRIHVISACRLALRSGSS